jgi:cytochrome c peroxidase
MAAHAPRPSARSSRRARLTALLAAAVPWATPAAAQAPTAADPELLAAARAAFAALPAPDPAARDQPAAQLGRQLFWDQRLSANGEIACASCHTVAAWGADARPTSRDARGRQTQRNSQTVFLALLQPKLRWTGDRVSGADQAERSLTGSMGFAEPADVVARLRQHGYEAAFRAAWPHADDPVTPQHYALALQAYQATLVTPAPFDRYLAGDPTALAPVQRAGLRAFLDAGCADCHDGALLGGTRLRRFGLEKPYWAATRSPTVDDGLFAATKVEADRYRFRVSMLRNVAKTGPYFHDGSVADLQEAVQVMADVQSGQRLAATDATAIVAFLEALTGDVPSHYAPPAAPAK